MDLLSKLRAMFKGGQNAMQQAPQTLRGLGNQVVSNFQWAGQQAQNNITKPIQNQVIKPFWEGLGRTQQLIESPRSTATFLPRFQAPQGASPLRKINTFVANIPIELASSVVGRGVLDPALDLGTNIARTATGRPLLPYEQTKSPLTRIGYQFAGGQKGFRPPQDTKRTLREAVGNIGGAAVPIIDASTGNMARNLATNMTGGALQQGIKRILARGAIEGGVMGGSSGLALGTSENRKTLDNGEYTKNVLTSLATGLAAGSVLGVGASGLGVLGARFKQAIQKSFPKAKPKEVEKIAKQFVRDEMGRFVSGKKLEAEPYFYGDLRESLGAPRNGEIQVGLSIKAVPGASGVKKPPIRSEFKLQPGETQADMIKRIQGNAGKAGGIDAVWNGNPTLKAEIDNAFSRGDTATVKKLLPQVPEQYKANYAPKSVDPLIQEARKYKSFAAFEYDNAQGFFRGQDGKMYLDDGSGVLKDMNKLGYKDAEDFYNQATKGADITKAIDTESSIRDNVIKIQQDFLDGKIDMNQRKILADKEFARSSANKGAETPQFSPTQMTRQEKVAKDMLKRGDITKEGYNNIAMKNEGVKPIPVQEMQKQGQQIKILKNIAKEDKQIARAEAELRAGVGADMGLTNQDRTKLGQLKSMFERADKNEGSWDVKSLKRNNKSLVNWATERWRELQPQKSEMNDDELINDIYDFVKNNQLSGKVKTETPATVNILQQAKRDQEALARITGYGEDQYPVRQGKPMTIADSEREQKLIEQSLQSKYGARNAATDELEAILNTPDNELKGKYTFEKGDKPVVTVKGKADEPKTFRQIINKYLGGKENTKITQYEQVKPISNVKFTDDGAKEAIKAIETGDIGGLPPQAQQYVSSLRKSFDKVREDAVAEGLPIGYVDNYLTHYWEQDPATVQAIIARLRTSGSFQNERTFLTYQEGIAAGLTPRFKNPTQILGNYVRQVENVKNNLRLINDLEKNGYVVNGVERQFAKGVREIAIPGFEGKFAKPEIAKIVEGLFEPREANKLIGMLGNISGRIQDITLSGGIPGTPFNAFSIAGNLQKQFLAGRFSGPLKSFARAFSPESTNKYFQENIPTIREIQDAGYSLPTTLSYTKLMGEEQTTAGKIWNAAVSDPTFKRFIPMMQIDLYKEVKNRALKSGLADEVARDKALAVLKNFEGMSDMYSRSTQDPNLRSGIQAIFFAPKFRQAIMGIWTSSIKALKNPLALENQYNVRFLAGSALAFAAMNAANAYFNNGKMMWENGRNKEDKLIIPDGKGGQVGIPLLSSLGTIPRGIARQAIKIVKGDISGAAADAGQTYLSSGIKPLADIAANQDYFGKTIVQPDSTNKWVDILKYLGKSYISHPYIKELIDPANTVDPAYQRLSRAMELPFRFYDKKSVDGSRFYEARDRAIEGMSEVERKAYDAIPKYDANDLNTQMYKYQTFLTYPNVFEAKRMTEFEMAKQTGKAIDPLYLVNFDTARKYMRYETLPPGSQDRKDMVKAFPELSALFDVRSKYFDENPIGTGTTSNKPIPNAYVLQQMDAKNWSDPQVRVYLDANTQYQNEQRAKLGLAPLAGFTSYAKKPKKVTIKLSKVKAPKLKAFKVKLPKLKKMKQPKIKLLKSKAKTITMKGIKT